MLNFLKTTLLLGAMSGLMLVVGALLGGGLSGDWVGALLGMACMLAVSTLLNFSTWFIADTLVIKSTGAVPVPENQLPWLHQDLAELAARAGIPKPRLYLVPHQMSPNAFATGRSPRKGVVAVTRGLLETLDRRGVRAVIAHEIGHIKNRDTLVSAIAATMASAITFLAAAARFAVGRRDMNPLVLLFIAVTAPVAALVIRMMISRTREYGADRRAAQLTGDPEGLALALEALGRGVQARPMQGVSARNVHHIVHGFTGGLAGLLSTHPPIPHRVAALRRMAAQQAAAQGIHQGQASPQHLPGPRF